VDLDYEAICYEVHDSLYAACSFVFGATATRSYIPDPLRKAPKKRVTQVRGPLCVAVRGAVRARQSDSLVLVCRQLEALMTVIGESFYSQRRRQAPVQYPVHHL
jgi:hypothetical protein